MQDRQRYFEGQLGRAGPAGGADSSRDVADVRNAFRELLNGVNGWEGRFSEVRFYLYVDVRLMTSENNS